MQNTICDMHIWFLEVSSTIHSHSDYLPHIYSRSHSLAFALLMCGSEPEHTYSIHSPTADTLSQSSRTLTICNRNMHSPSYDVCAVPAILHQTKPHHYWISEDHHALSLWTLYIYICSLRDFPKNPSGEHMFPMCQFHPPPFPPSHTYNDQTQAMASSCTQTQTQCAQIVFKTRHRVDHVRHIDCAAVLVRLWSNWLERFALFDRGRGRGGWRMRGTSKWEVPVDTYPLCVCKENAAKQ